MGDETNIPQIQLRTSQLEREGRGEMNIKRREVQLEGGFIKIEIKKGLQKNKREKVERETFLRFLVLDLTPIPWEHCFCICNSLFRSFYPFKLLFRSPIVELFPIFLEIIFEGHFIHLYYFGGCF